MSRLYVLMLHMWMHEKARFLTHVSSVFLYFVSFSDQLRNSYQIGYDGSLRIIYASGMDSHYQTEPHVLAGTANPTVAKRNMTLPGENGQNLVEWRFRKEQAQGKVNVFGRKLRVSKCSSMYDTDGIWCSWVVTQARFNGHCYSSATEYVEYIVPR